ncbi:MAG: hypothetical protein JW840_10640 [Candidatus Thermoplasmatota archaeon]|nr:hypothetical protein [Candidatus Thermoplasmatota archaeon]
MKKKQQLVIRMLLMAAGLVALGTTTAAALTGETDLFVTLDSAWEHANAGDTFVVRADVKNIGEQPALITWIRLENIPDDWEVQPPKHLILILQPNETQTAFFAVERGPSDATIYATASAYNAATVQSNRIAIPINLWIVVGISLVCGVVAYREIQIRKK